MYSFIGVSWEVCIKARSQRFVHQHLPASTGGTFLIWIENHSRVLMYVLLFFFLTFTELDHLHNFLLVSAAVIVGANLVMS